MGQQGEGHMPIDSSPEVGVVIADKEREELEPLHETAEQLHALYHLQVGRVALLQNILADTGLQISNKMHADSLAWLQGS